MRSAQPVDDLSTLPLRELIALARSRLGAGAARLKTRAEFVAALTQGSAAPLPDASSSSPPPPAAAAPAVVTRDFFVARPA